ncbi:MAG TPA: PhzF family phenazine biosynthesis protein [Candidatus Limnocylindrales bacterium]|nr:PhzF family phenazine biosynthesis protein [Candidatus Limnocylindrales bacterium]
MTATDLTVLKVFVGPDGRGGNPLGVFLDGSGIARDRRQGIAYELGFSETVFVDDPAAGRIQILTPARELPFAGHPSVGTSWLLHETGTPIATLRPPAGDVPVRRDAERTWVAADPGWVAHAFEFVQLPSAPDVEAFRQPAMGEPGRYVWAWIDEEAGEVRSRSFPTDFGILEDEATGLAAVMLSGRLGRDLTIRQGVGSEILARLRPDGMVEIGGRVELVERRPFVFAQ